MLSRFPYHRIAVALVLGFALYSIPSPSLSQTDHPFLAARLSFDKPLYAPTDTIQLSMIVDNLGSEPVAGLRLHFRIREYGDERPLIYRNRFPGRLESGSHPSDVDIALDDRLGSGVYEAELIVFQYGQPVEIASYPLVIAETVPTLRVALLFSVRNPVATAPDGTLVNDSLIRIIEKEGRLARRLNTIITGQLPVVLDVSPSTLRELEALSNGCFVETTTGVRRVTKDDPAAANATESLKTISRIITENRGTLVFSPLFDPLLPPMIWHGHTTLVAGFLADGRDETARILGTQSPPRIVSPPSLELVPEALPLIADHAAALLARAGPNLDTAILARNIVIYPVDGGLLPQPTTSTPEALAAAFVRNVASSQLAAGRERLILVPADDLDRDHLRALKTIEDTTPFIDFVLLGTEEPPSTSTTYTPIPIRGETDAQKEHFTMADRVADRLKTYTELVINEDEHKELLGRLLQAGVALIPRSSEESTALAHRYFDAIESTITADLSSITFEKQPVSLSSRSGKIPILISKTSPRFFECTLEVESDDFTFPEGNAIPVVLSAKDNVVAVPVRARRPGNLSVRATLRAPDGEVLLTDVLVVRSAYFTWLLSYLVLAIVILGILLAVRRIVRRRRQP